MQCPTCGAEMPEGTKFCGACGGAVDAGGAQAPAPVTPTAPMPVAETPPPPAPAPAYAPPPQYAAAPQYPAQAPTAPPKKKRTGLIVALVIIAFLMLCCLASAIGGYLYFWSQADKTPTPDVPAASDPLEDLATDEDAEIVAAATVVEDYYAAIGNGDMDAIGTLLASSVAEEVTPDWYEGWDPTTVFEFTRGVLDGDTAIIYGRESIQAYGSGDDGGVKFTLVKEDGEWRITAWAGADRAQIEGSDTTGSSSGVKATLSDKTAREIVTRLLDARRVGNANAIRQLTTEHFQSEYGDVWLDGVDNTEYFLSYSITDVSVSGSRATVTTNEEWNSGPEPATYTVVEEGGVLLVDTWD